MRAQHQQADAHEVLAGGSPFARQDIQSEAERARGLQQTGAEAASCRGPSVPAKAAGCFGVGRRARGPATSQQVVEQPQDGHPEHEHEGGSHLGRKRVHVGELLECRERPQRQHRRQHDQHPGGRGQDDAAIVLAYDAGALQPREQRRRQQRGEPEGQGEWQPSA